MIDFGLTDDEQAVIEAATKVAVDPDPWNALAEGGWLDLLITNPDSGLHYLGLVAEQLGWAGTALPVPGTAAVWPTLFGEALSGQRVGVVDGGLGEDSVDADLVVILTDRHALAYDRFTVERVGGLDGDGLARVAVEGDPVAVADDPTRVALARLRAAALAAAEMAGAMKRVAQMTAHYAAERQQFGRTISSFQVVQHGIARLTILSEAATWLSRLAYCEPEPAHVHAAKGWVSAASVEASAVAHQLHGAVGFTEEYGLQHFTKRLRILRFAWADDRTHYVALGRRRTIESAS